MHAFALYRSGWFGEEIPWDDNQLWARGMMSLPALPLASHTVTLEPVYGSAASWYQVHLDGLDSPEVGWITYRCRLIIDNTMMGAGPVPLSWYTGSPSDWPSGLARFPEAMGPELPTHRWPKPGPRGVWTLAARRHH